VRQPDGAPHAHLRAGDNRKIGNINRPQAARGACVSRFVSSSRQRDHDTVSNRTRRIENQALLPAFT
jgi:hypothetical protein